jgi:outer membrane protein assembly factor BamE (lipoprotein component of BamABCDE complex)
MFRKNRAAGIGPYNPHTIYARDGDGVRFVERSETFLIYRNFHAYSASMFGQNRFAFYLCFLLLGGGLFMNACTPTKSARGNMVEDFRMAELTPGISTRQNVLQSLGSPTVTAPFDPNTWYYIGQQMEKKGVFDPEVTEERIIVASFDEAGILQNLQESDTDRVDVPISDRITPTGGNEVTAIEQIIGNIGRFNRSGASESATTTAGGF